MKEGICTMMGIVGSTIATLFGGWDMTLKALIIFMIVDFVSGLVVAGVFKKSKKSQNGALKSKIGWEGLCRKGMTILFVLIAALLDIVIGTSYIRDAVCIGFLTNELISIVENAGLMGIPLSPAISKAIDILTSKSVDN